MTRAPFERGLPGGGGGLLWACSLLLAGLASPLHAAPPDTVRVVDDRGDTLRFAEPPSRVVSLIPTATEILFALGTGDRLVGRTRYGTHPPAARDVPSVGEGVRPSIEEVRARRPDLVVLFAGQSNQKAARDLDRLRIRTLGLVHNSLEDFERNVRRLGRIMGRGEAADSLLAAVGCQLRSVARISARRPVRTVYYDLWWSPARTIGAGSHIDSLITLGGGRNVFGDIPRSSARISLEALVEKNPDLLLRPEGSGETGGTLPPAERPGWTAVPAVRRGEVRSVDGDLVHRLGPQVGRAAAEVAAAIHPPIAGRLRRSGLLSGEAPTGCPASGDGGAGGQDAAGRR